jgi:hypothetical protein
MNRTFRRFRGGALAVAILVAGGGTLALGATPAGASNVQVTSAGSFTTYQLMHALFPTSINNLLPGGTTAHQTIAATATLCTGGKTYNSGTPAPNGSSAGKTALHAEEILTSATADKKGCITFARSSSPPQTSTISTHFDYYAYALDGVAPMVGTNAGGSVTSPAAFTLAELRGIYHCTTGHTTWASLGGSTGAIIRFWPQSGSGTRSVFTGMLGFTPAKTATKGTCATPAITKFTVSGTKVTNEENTESGLVYATKVLHDTVKDAIFIYSAGKFVSQWNNITGYGPTGHNRISGTVTGNFTSTKVEYASFRLRKTTGGTTATGAAQKFVNFTATTSGRTTVKAGVNTATVTEANEWYSHIPASADPAKTSVSRIPGVRYVYNVCDTKTPGYSTCKALVGFDNQNHAQTGTQTTGLGTKSRLCAGDDASTIGAQGFVTLTRVGKPRGTTSSNLASATCREFPGKNYPGLGTAKSWTFNTWVNPTGSTGEADAAYTEQAGYPAVDNTGTTLPVTTAAVGDVMLVMAHTAPSSGTSEVTSITDSNSRITWQATKSTGFTNHPSGDAIEIWYGVVKSVGSTTIDAHWSGPTFDHFVWADEWKSVLGPSVSWSVVSSGVKNAAVGTGTTCPYPTLTSGPAGGLYWGWAYGSAAGSAGNSPGFSYYVTTQPTHENALVSDPALAGSKAYTPAFTQAKATSWYDAASVIVEAVAASP